MPKLDTALTTFILLIYIGAFTPSKFQEGQGIGDDPAGKIGNFLSALAAPLVVVLIVRNWERFLNALRRVTWPLFLVALTVLSTFWAVDPHITLRRAIVFSVVTAYAVHLGSLGPELRDRLLGRAVVVTIVFSFLVVLLLPAYGISGGSHFGEWRGVFDHKNIMGRQMVFTFFLALYSQAFQSRIKARLVAALAVFLLVMSHSGTGISAFGIVLIFAGLLAIRSFFAKRLIEPMFWLIIVPSFVVVVAVGFGLRNEIFQLLGKDESLTGRTTIWAVVFEGIAKKPYFGWGYDSFFTQRELRDSFGAAGLPNHSHNGFFDVIIATGFFGFAIFLIGFLIAFKNAWRVYRASFERSAQWPLLFLVMLVFLNLTESNLLRRGTFMWIPYVSLLLWGMRGTPESSAYGGETRSQNLPLESVSA